MIYRIALLIVGLLSLLALAASDRNQPPDPELLLETDSYSIAVVVFRPEDEAIKQLLEVALLSISSGETKLPDSMSEVTDYLSRNNRVDLLFAGLPFQAVRVDRMLPGQQTSPSYALTLAGWKGLQSQVFNSLSISPGGQTFPTVRYRITDLVSRDHWDDPTWAGTMCRVKGTFLFSPGADQAKRTVDRLAPKGKPTGPLPGPLLTAYRSISKTPDAFGVLLNQGGSISALLKSADNPEVARFRERVGSDRFERAVAAIHSVVWRVEIVSSERAELEAVLSLDPKDQAEVAAVLEEGRANLDTEKVSEFSVTQDSGAVTIKAAVIGLKKLLLDELARSVSP
jgi:hypothetical protein